MIHIYVQFVYGYFKDNFSKIFFNLLSISLGIALFISTQINGWKAEKSLVDQTIGYSSETFLGRYVSLQELKKSNQINLKEIDFALPETIMIEPELQVKGYFKISGNQVISVPTIGKDLLTNPGLESPNKRTSQVPKYFFSNSLIQKFNTRDYPIVLNICENDIKIFENEIQEISQDGLFVMIDIERLQNICDLKNIYTSINLSTRSPIKHKTEQLKSNIPNPNWLFESKEEILERAGIALGSLKINLTIISLVSVLISFFMVSNIYTGLYLSRKNEFGILLSLGGSKFNNFSLFITLSLVLGILGGILGACIGITISNLNLAQTVNTLTDSTQITTYKNFPPSILVFGFIISILGSILSAIFNAIKAYKILPIELLREKTDFETKPPLTLSKLKLSILSISFILLGIALGNINIKKEIIPGLIGVGSVILGFVMLNYISIPFVIKLIDKLTKGWNLSASFLLGIKEIEIDSWKNSLTISTIMLSTSLVFTLTTLTASYESSLKKWIGDENKSDYSLIDEKKLSSGEPGVPISLLEKLKKDETFSDVEPFYINSKFIVNGKYFTLHALNFDSSLNKDAILVSKNLCFLENLCNGDSITINSPLKGNVILRIQGEREHFFSERGTILIDYQLFQKLFSTNFLNSIRLTLNKGVERNEATRKMNSISEENNLIFLDQIKLKELYLTGMNQVFSVLDTLKLSAIIISILALITSVFYYIKEKSRILAGLKAIGMSFYQLFLLLYYQTFFLLSFGVISGIVNSIILSPIVIYGINQNAFGWTLNYTYPVHFVAYLSIIIPIFAGLVCVIPFYFLYKMKISKELSYE